MSKGRTVDLATRARITAEAARLYQSGLNLRDTADAVGVPYTTTYTWLTEAGFTLRAARRTGPLPVDPAVAELRKALQARYYAGQTIQEIADTTGLSYGAARRHLTKVNTVFRPTGKRSDKLKEQACSSD